MKQVSYSGKYSFSACRAVQDVFCPVFLCINEKIITPTTVQICRLENIEHKTKNMKQVSYSGKYSLSASRDYQSHLQFSFVVGMLSLW